MYDEKNGLEMPITIKQLKYWQLVHRVEERLEELKLSSLFFHFFLWLSNIANFDINR